MKLTLNLQVRYQFSAVDFTSVFPCEHKSDVYSKSSFCSRPHIFLLLVSPILGHQPYSLDQGFSFNSCSAHLLLLYQAITPFTVHFKTRERYSVFEFPHAQTTSTIATRISPYSPPRCIQPESFKYSIKNFPCVFHYCIN